MTPRFTGATAGDMPFIEATIEELRLDGERLAPEQFILLRLGDRALGFGRIKPYEHVCELGSVAVLESARGRGYGRLIVEELIRRFPVDDVWITTDLPGYFERFGFRQVAQAPPELADKLARICGRLRTGVVPMHLERAARR